MSQRDDYPHEVVLPDDATLKRVVRGLLDEAPHHQHNFEVWHDVLTIRLNALGFECVQRLTAPPSEVVPPLRPCVVCGRVDGIVMSERGPVKTPLVIEQIGNFRFCVECLTDSRRDEVVSGEVVLERVIMASGPMTGHAWITATRGVNA